MVDGWRRVAGIVKTKSGKPPPSCHIDVRSLTADVLVLEVAVFSDEEGRWTHTLRADAEFRLIARTRPGSVDGEAHIPAGRADIDGVEIVLDNP